MEHQEDHTGELFPPLRGNEPRRRIGEDPGVVPGFLQIQDRKLLVGLHRIQNVLQGRRPPDALVVVVEDVFDRHEEVVDGFDLGHAIADDGLDPVHVTLVQRRDDGALVGEVLVDRRDRTARQGCDLLHRDRIDALAADQVHGDLEDIVDPFAAAFLLRYPPQQPLRDAIQRIRHYRVSHACREPGRRHLFRQPDEIHDICFYGRKSDPDHPAAAESIAI